MESSNHARMRILDLVAQGKLSVQEAEALLGAAAAAPTASAAAEPEAGANQGRRPRRMRIQVSDLHTQRTKVNLILPLGVVKAGLRLGAALKPWTWGGEAADGEAEGRPPKEVLAHLGDDLLALQALFDEAEVGPMVDVYDEEDGEHVLIALE